MPSASIMNPDPSDCALRWRLLSPKFLKNSSNGDPGGNCGISTLGPSFTIVVVEILTTDGDSFSTSSANESGRSAADRPNETNIIVNATAKDTTRSLRI